ncbi:MAG: hypothetical protein COV02_00335 [Candidatus Terrybacteria bacterium CG10_big_fil_rev_8_21_14_0_10_41_10]|uniref:ATP synthase subunit a n=1 Tax=Candidatus Terrybacteria bacterium CG10_big_fil_rev_8_21_14_0_10_41_10 TaxID=1975026 RepID=A0A2M8LBJ4_9BACT|nr:MAG: hypothetical protein COV02_00335 [Candidatus Terrybacteria bacterium CG10_big_fil_rev_8_21_14_0_10_41_10]
MLNFLQVKSDLPAISPEVIFNVGDFPVSSSVLLGFAILMAIAVFCFVCVKKYFSIKPGSGQTFVEILYEGMIGMITQITASRSMSEKMLPLIGSLFIFIGISNLIELIPGIGSITFGGKAIFRAPTSDFNTTFALAFAMILVIQAASIKSWGLFGYFGKYFQFKEIFKGFRNNMGEGMMSIINFLIGLMDIISEVAKVISLSFRLFGNIYAGQVMAVIIMGALAYALPAVWSSLGILFGVVQAIVFGSLVAAYYMIALKPESNGT